MIQAMQDAFFAVLLPVGTETEATAAPAAQPPPALTTRRRCDHDDQPWLPRYREPVHLAVGALVAAAPLASHNSGGSRASDPYSSFTVRKPITVRGGIAAPWMDSPSGGVQYLLPRSVQDLLDGGFLG